MPSHTREEQVRKVVEKQLGRTVGIAEFRQMKARAFKDQGARTDSGLPILDEARDAIRRQSFEEEPEVEAPVTDEERGREGEKIVQPGQLDRLLDILNLKFTQIENKIGGTVRGANISPIGIAGNIQSRLQEPKGKESIFGLPIIRGISDITKQITNLITGSKAEGLELTEEDILREVLEQLGLESQDFQREGDTAPSSLAIRTALRGAGTFTLGSGVKIRIMKDNSIRRLN